MNNKIFIQIASYRDPELLNTIRDCLANAENPERLVFSIAWQHNKADTWDSLDEFKNDSRFKIIDIDYKDAKGCCWARNLLQQQYDGEQYTLQLDSHHRFIKKWDTEIIAMYEGLRKDGVKKPLITGYIPPYSTKNDTRGEVPYKMNFDRFTPEGVVFFLPATIDNYKELTKPIQARFYSAHFAFASGQFVKEVPHDPNYNFHGEEISIGVRAFTWGYDLFHSHKIIAWHEYTREGRVRFWDDDKQWSERDRASHLRNRKLFEMDGSKKDINFGIYDFGKVRSLEDYERYAGLSFKKRAVQKYTLDNKLAPNPALYGQEYEDTFLKIFKHCIDVHISQFKERDYKFIAVIFEGENGQLNRKDLEPKEIKQLFAQKKDFVNIWREFLTEEKPTQWVVWPYSNTTDYWAEKITGKL